MNKSRRPIFAAAVIAAAGFIGLTACDGETPTAVTSAANQRHIYLRNGGNPDGLYEDFNARVNLCTQLLAGEPID